MAEAELGNAAAAKESLRLLSDSISQQKPGMGYTDILHIDLLQAQAVVEAVSDNPRKAVKILKTAIRFEQKHPVEYPNVLAPPIAELLGQMLLRQHRTNQACAAYQSALAVAPGTLNAVKGLQEAKAGIPVR